MGRRPLFIMNEIKRLTLVSDPTNEFPNNANNSFKVRLPERLSLPGTGWHAALLSLTVPDQGQSNAVIAADPHTEVVKFGVTYLTRKWTDTGNPSTSGYLRVSFKPKEYTVELEEIMSARHTVTSGNEFWQRVMQEVYNTSMRKLIYEKDYAETYDGDDKPIVSLKKNWMPMMSWKNNALILHAVPKAEMLDSTKTRATSTFSLDLGVAETFGFVYEPQGVTGHVLGPNLQFYCPTLTYTDQSTPAGSRFRSSLNWNGEHYVGTQPTDLTRETSDQLFIVKNKRLHLSRSVEWQFNNLNTSFEKAVGTRKRTVMVYSDLVESTVVGSGKFPLLREVQLLRTGDGESTAEPLHHQWIKVRGQQMDILEVEIASTSGPLAILPPGKTLVTIGLKQL